MKVGIISYILIAVKVAARRELRIDDEAGELVGLAIVLTAIFIDYMKLDLQQVTGH